MQSKKAFQLSGIAAALAALYAFGSAQAFDTAKLDLPDLPDAKPGQCYAKVVIPPQYKTEPVEVVAQEAVTRFEAVPPQYTTTEQRVLVKEAASDIAVVPPTYETVQKTVELEPARRSWVSGRSFHATPVSNTTLGAIAASGVKLDELPSGSCLNEYYVPPQYEDKPVKVLKTEGYEQVEVVPAQYDWVEEKVLVKEAGTRYVEVPPVYETTSEQVLVSPATTEWKRGSGPYQKIDNTTGEIMCLVEVPAKYKTVTHKVLKTPATTRKVEVPAEYAIQRVLKLVKPAEERRVKVEPVYQVLNQTVKTADEKYLWQSDKLFSPDGAYPTGQSVCLTATPARFATVEQVRIKTPAQTRKVEIPAEYQTVAVQKLVKPSEVHEVHLPAEVETLPRQIRVSPERSEWRQVLCETNTTPEVVMKVQGALMKAGFDPGPLNGRLGSQTLRAVEEFQRKQGLERGGLTLNTLQKLGVGI